MFRLFLTGSLFVAAAVPASADDGQSRPERGKQQPAAAGGNLKDAARDLFPALIEALADEDPVVAENARVALAGCGGEAVPFLVEVIKGKDARARFQAIWAVYAMGKRGQGALGTLVPILKDKKEAKEIRQAASYAIASVLGGYLDPALAAAYSQAPTTTYAPPPKKGGVVPSR